MSASLRVAVLATFLTSLACQNAPPHGDGSAPVLAIVEKVRKAVDQLELSHRSRDDRGFDAARDQVREQLFALEALVRGGGKVAMPSGKAKVALRDGSKELAQQTGTVCVTMDQQLVDNPALEAWLIVIPEQAPGEAWVQPGALSMAETARAIHFGDARQPDDQHYHVGVWLAPKDAITGEGMVKTSDLRSLGAREIGGYDVLRRGVGRAPAVARQDTGPDRQQDVRPVTKQVEPINQEDPAASGKTFRNQELTTAAWAALDRSDYDAAIVAAEACITAFAKRADEEHTKLKAKGVAPATGSVDEATKRDIHKNGLVNDVAACHFIVGKANEGLRRYPAARQAYVKAQALDYARCWDANGWFWSPAEGAAERLSALKDKK